MLDQEKSDARERVLEAGRTLLAQRGYGGVSIADISAQAGVPRGSFYYFFGSKQALALAVIEEHWTAQRQQWRDVLTSDAAPLDRLRTLFTITAETQRTAQHDTGAVIGCLFGNLSIEMSGEDEIVRARLQDIFTEQIDLVADVVRDITPGTGSDARNTARSIVAQLEGLVIFAKLFNDASHVDPLWQHSLKLLGVSAPISSHVSERSAA